MTEHPWHLVQQREELLSPDRQPGAELTSFPRLFRTLTLTTLSSSLHSVGKHHENEIRYQPFRMTPYLVKVQEQQGTESQLCCLLLAERVHSGYEGTAMPDQSLLMLTCPFCL